MTSAAPSWKNFALPSVGSPPMKTTLAVFGSFFSALRPSTISWPSSSPTFVLSKET